MSERNWWRLLPWMSAFAIAMAFLEAAVVVYLRALYYPDGFTFPLVPIDHDMGTTEVLREAATLLMLIAPAALVAQRMVDRFAWFCFLFGAWDIFYYVWLKVLLGWPATLLEWDILFLIPVPWVGPVLAPCLVSLGLIALALILLRRGERGISPALPVGHLLLMLLGGTVMLWSLLEDPIRHVAAQGSLVQILSVGPGGTDTFAHITTYVPGRFSWGIFSSGCGLATAGLADLARRRTR